jgi:hypothetical protein
MDELEIGGQRKLPRYWLKVCLHQNFHSFFPTRSLATYLYLEHMLQCSMLRADCLIIMSHYRHCSRRFRHDCSSARGSSSRIVSSSSSSSSSREPLSLVLLFKKRPIRPRTIILFRQMMQSIVPDLLACARAHNNLPTFMCPMLHYTAPGSAAPPPDDTRTRWLCLCQGQMRRFLFKRRQYFLKSFFLSSSTTNPHF